MFTSLHNTRWKRIAGMAAVVVGATAMAPCALAAFPEKPIKIVVPFAPGGGTDMVARGIGQPMAEMLGQPVIIENKPGGGTLIGTDQVARSAPDGYTMVMATLAHVVNPSIHPKMPYSNDAFAGVMLVGRSPNVLVVRAESPYKSVDDVLKAARANPGKLTYASQGAGTSAHLAGELFKNLAKVDIVHIPYRGAGPAINDLMGGQVDIMFATAASVGTSIEGGRLRPLAVTTAQRSPAPVLAKVPTIAESGVPGYVADSWYGLFAPAGTPPAVLARLNAAAKSAVQTESFRKRVENEGLVISAGTPEDFDKYAKQEEERWRKVVKAAGITAE